MLLVRGYCPAFHRGDVGSELVHSVLHLWLKKRHCVMFFSESFGFLVAVSSNHYSTFLHSSSLFDVILRIGKVVK